ncbi:MAG TPA: alpha-2-macroglobulin family protein, partial [Saprospiraceae bacterium]|nr:alpha-2-macroglobulin family protein [Saprospiraceae bacterium]
RKHEFVISNYIGSVRVMLIANETNAFGSTDKSVPVRRELMAQLTAPRVFSIGDEVLVPVTIFATDPNVKNVQVTLSVKGRLELLDPAQKQIRFDRTGDQTVFYRVKGTRQTGNAELLATATSGSYSANSSIAFYVDNPNPVTHESKSFWVEPGKQITESIAAYGTSGPRTVRMEVSGIPGLSIRKMVDQLIRYPHGCLEQTISSAFPQMVLSTLLDLNADQNAEITTNLQAAMDKIRRFQLSDGSFSYWPGMPDYSDWNTTYAGQFLIEAKNSGFRVPEDVLQKWYVFERSRANGFTVDKRNPYARPYLHQAFRLYVLALFGKPEWSAMNQLYQLKTNDIMTNVLLAASFAKSGKKEMADALYTQAGKAVAPYREHRFSYGSSIRDEAFIAQLLVLMNKESEAAERLSRILKQTGGQDYLNTQEMSMVLLAVSRLYGKENQGNNRFSYSWNGKKVDASKSHFVYETELIPSPQQLLEFTNHASAPVSVTIIQTGKEDYGAAMQVNKGLNLTVRYVHEAAGLANLVSGDPVMAEIIVSNPATGGRIDNIAMTAVFPGGLEIDNRRIGGIEELPSGIDFQDFRDDRVMSYMSLNAGEQKIIRIPLTAAYAGKYSAPAYYCEAMYDPSQYARYRSGSLQIRSRK